MSQRVPFTTDPLNKKPCNTNGHDRRPSDRSGTWVCKLTTLTPLSIHALFKNLREHEPAHLPGSALRGMVRNVAEMLGAGCVRFYDRPSTSDVDTCTRDATCVSCRLFGFVEGDFGWAGKVRFEDTAAQQVRWARYQMPSQRPPQAAGSGWILFPYVRPQLDSGPIRCVPEQTSFQFRVAYTNLDADEYSVLKFALTLKHRTTALCHMLGYGKSLGFGACVVEIVNDTTPAIDAEISHYLGQPAFRQLETHRRRP